MSVEDETWDRPYCEFCNSKILYGEHSLHRGGVCIKSKTEDILCDKCLKYEEDISRLHQECKKYRVALNQIAHPETWGINRGYHEEIARRVLLLGITVELLPEGAKYGLHGRGCKCLQRTK